MAVVQTFKRYNRQRKALEFVTELPYEKGARVFDNYGDYENHDLMLDYGFVIPDNTEDTVPIDLEVPEDENYALRMDAIQEKQLT